MPEFIKYELTGPAVNFLYIKDQFVIGPLKGEYPIFEQDPLSGAHWCVLHIMDSDLEKILKYINNNSHKEIYRKEITQEQAEQLKSSFEEIVSSQDEFIDQIRILMEGAVKTKTK